VLEILEGDCRDVLRSLPDESVDCVVTSPPYWGLRDYGVIGQLGAEKTPDEYVRNLVAVFAEVRRVLTPRGTVWLNLGDSYNNRTKVRTTSHEPKLNGFADDNWSQRAARGGCRMSLTSGGLKEKDLIGVPWMAALALRADGWYLRQDIIWAKTFGKPETVADRVTRAHEHLFLLTKSKRYHFDRKALGDDFQRSVWTINPGGYKGAHFAVMPMVMAARCIEAGCTKRGTVLDPFAGASTTGLAAALAGRKAVMIELKPEYITLSRQRIDKADLQKQPTT
jgi:site-specific DNA-methyltransferase (cytosine-N4-specific)